LSKLAASVLALRHDPPEQPPDGGPNSDAFKSKMVQRLVGPDAVSANRL